MNINELTIKQATKLMKLFEQTSNQDESHWEIGKNYLVKTVLMIYCGKLKAVTDKEIIMSQSAWIADTGRFHNALRDGIEIVSNSEIEPFLNDVIIGRGALISATVYNHKLNWIQK